MEDDYRLKRAEENAVKWNDAYEKEKASKGRWVGAFWAVLVAGVFIFIVMAIVASNTDVVQTGYTPEEVNNLAIKVYHELCKKDTQVIERVVHDCVYPVGCYSPNFEEFNFSKYQRGYGVINVNSTTPQRRV